MDGKESERLSIDATPIQVCGSVLGRLAELWDELAERAGEGHGKFIEEIAGRIWRDNDTGEKFSAELDKWEEQPDEMKAFGLLQAVLTACAYACQGMKAQKAEDILRAWQYTARAEYWVGVVVGVWNLLRDKENPAIEFSKIGSDARHKENRAMTKEVIAWFKEHGSEVGSKNKAVAEIKKLVPLSESTIRRKLQGI
jgi:hypothetical protein